MNNILIYAALLATAGVTFASCSEEKLDPTSVITPQKVVQNDFDKWIKANYIDAYNIDFKYRYDDIETNMNYYHVPADYKSAVKLAHIVKYACLEAYDQVAGPDFIRANFPKMLYATGDFQYDNNGTATLGAAEGGKKIFLAGVNHLDQYMTSRAMLNQYYLKTIHHEFGHIFHQTVDYPVDFKLVTASDYVSDSWSNTTYGVETYYLPHGFVTAYAQKSHEEDFCETLSVYICNSQQQWDALRTKAGDEGAALIDKKIALVKSYMASEWNIDLDQLRAEVLSRENNVISGAVNLEDLSVK